MAKTTYQTTIVCDEDASFIPVTVDPKEVFGKVRAPVRVTVNGYTYRSTIAAMGGQVCIPLRKSNREAAGLKGGETLDVTLELDTEERKVEIPSALNKALTAKARKQWNALSYTRQREYAEAINDAKKPETRTRRIEKILTELDSPGRS
jgi:hypothetical protein